MTNKATGWALAAASLGMMLVLISADVKNLKDVHDVYTPWFVGNVMAHLGNILIAFVGGKLIPTEPQDQRKDDQ